MTANVTPNDAENGAEPLKQMAVIRPKKAKAPVGKPVDDAHLPLIEAAVLRATTKGEPKGAGNAFEDEVLPLFNQTRDDYLSLARRVALMLHKRLQRPISVDDVRAVVPPPSEWDGRLMGAVFKTEDWTWVAYERSTRSTCHKRPISTFEPTNA
jgi:hypothetical protein